MTVLVHIPSQIRRLYGTQSQEQVEAETVSALIDILDERFPGLGERLTEPDGQIRRWVNVFVDGRDIRTLQGMDTTLQSGAKVYIVPAIAGG